GFVQGRPVDGFTGAIQESQIKSFIDRLTGGAKAPMEEALEAGKQALEAGDAGTASSHFAEVLAQDPVHPGAIAGMIRCFVVTGETGHAQEVIDRLPPELLKNTEIAAAVSAMELAEQGSESVDTAAFEERLAADENNHEARFELANALYGAGRSEEAIEHLVEIVRRDREWNEEAARMQLIKIFDALGPTHPLTVQGRRQLSSVLFS
ncbi:MAG: tetratricopeptide repeat protein, partial [Rhodospirillales bacterium]|nr:tetratricopeptide repeat protein [Rhodospirillales bacterium]